MEEDFEVLDIRRAGADGGFVEGFVAAGAGFASSGFLRSEVVPGGFAEDEVEMLADEAKVERGGARAGG